MWGKSASNPYPSLAGVLSWKFASEKGYKTQPRPSLLRGDESESGNTTQRVRIVEADKI